MRRNRRSASIDTLLVRVTAIALCFVTFGLAIVLYLVLFAILPIKPSSGSFIDLEPSRVQSERYRRVVNLSKDHVLSGKPEVRVYEQKAPTPAVLHSEEPSTPSYRLPLVFFGLAFLITTVVIVVATLAEEGRSFVSFLPLYFIPAGVFFLVSPSARRTIPIRICIFLLFCEACCVALPFTVGLYDFRNFFRSGTHLLCMGCCASAIVRRHHIREHDLLCWSNFAYLSGKYHYFL